MFCLNYTEPRKNDRHNSQVNFGGWDGRRWAGRRVWHGARKQMQVTTIVGPGAGGV